ncbi:MAG: hypothetical protein AAF702_48595 [Chloroflexota bacterium]
MLNHEQIKQALTHVLWIGGSPDAGKTSVGTALAEKKGWLFYSCDEHAEALLTNHILNDPVAFWPTWVKRPVDARWLEPVENQAQNMLRIETDLFPWITSELLTMSTQMPIVVEGNLPPNLISPYLTTKHQALWMIPTPAFARASFDRRGKDDHSERSDPRRVRENHMARDRLLGEHSKREAEARALKVLEIDGTHPIEEVSEIARNHFEPHLSQQDER